MSFSVNDVTLTDADQIERERIHLLLIDDAARGLADITAGRTIEASAAIATRQQQRAETAGTSTKKRG